MSKQPIAAMLTDLHLKDDNWPTILNVFAQTMNFCDDNGIKQIICLGDIFHSRKAQSLFMLTTFEGILNELHKEQFKMISIVGNHDKTDYRSKESFLAPFKHHPALTLFEEYHTLEIAGLDLHFLSYFDEDIYLQYLEKNKGLVSKNSVLLTHIGVDGAKMNNGTEISSSITPKVFSKYKQVYIGHYHDGQQLGKNIQYTGASLQHNYGEGGQKGVQVLYNDGTIDLVELDFPKFLTYQVAVKDLTNDDLKQLAEEKQNSNDFIRVQLIGEERDLKAFNVQSLMQVGVDVQIKQEDIEVTELQNRIEPFNADTLKEQFIAFCEENSLDLAQGMEYFNTIATQNV